MDFAIKTIMFHSCKQFFKTLQQNYTHLVTYSYKLRVQCRVGLKLNNSKTAEVHKSIFIQTLRTSLLKKLPN